jgi:hypothetical protein
VTAPARSPLPLALVVLDMIGMGLAGLSAAQQFGGVGVLPAALRFPGDSLLLMVLGVALMLPLIVHVVRVALSGQRP